MALGYVGKSPLTAALEPGCGSGAPQVGAPGKRTLTEALPVIQRKGDPSSSAGEASVHASAARGVATAASPLPFAEQIQRAFGRHDVSSILAHTGGEAAASAREMGAAAYAAGNHVVLGERADLHTVAHEAAHVVQQRGGVQLKGGVGDAGDSYERHADEVADRVVAGASAEPLLDRFAAVGAVGRGVVQRVRITVDKKTFELANLATAAVIDLLRSLVDRRSKKGGADARQGGSGASSDVVEVDAADDDAMTREELQAAISAIENHLRTSGQDAKSKLCRDLATTREAAEASDKQDEPDSGGNQNKVPKSKRPDKAVGSAKKSQGAQLSAAHVQAVLPFLVELSGAWIDAQTALNLSPAVKGSEGAATFVDMRQAVIDYKAQIRNRGAWGDVAEADAIARHQRFHCEILQADEHGQLYLAATIGTRHDRHLARKLYHDGAHYMVLRAEAAAGQPAPDDGHQDLVFQNPKGDGDCLYASLQILISNAPIVQDEPGHQTVQGQQTVENIMALRGVAADHVDDGKIELLLTAQMASRRSATPTSARALFGKGLQDNPPLAVKQRLLTILEAATPECKSDSERLAKKETAPWAADWKTITNLVGEYQAAWSPLYGKAKAKAKAKVDAPKGGEKEVEQGGKSDVEQDPAELVAMNLLIQITDLSHAFQTKYAQSGGVSNMPRVLIGNEFTFTDGAMAKVVDGSRAEKDVELAMKAPYEAALKRWEAAAAKRDLKAEKSQYAGHPSLIYRFEEPVWHYEVTRDQGCVEVVTAPIAASALYSGEIASIIDNAIFGVAADAGLEAHATIGSGHINIDRATAFGEDPDALLRFIEAFYADAEYWKGEDPDKANAPFPDEHGKPQQDRLAAVVKRFHEAKKTSAPWTIDRLATELTNCFTDNLVGKPAKQSPHYQAVNVEHMNDRDPRARRLEVRRVPAQTDREHLLRHLTRIGGLLEQSKKGSD